MERPTKRPRISEPRDANTFGAPHEIDVNAARQANDLRLKSRFEDIFEKYGKDFGSVGDEIDLATGKIIVNNGHIGRMRNEQDLGEPAWNLADPFGEDDCSLDARAEDLDTLTRGNEVDYTVHGLRHGDGLGFGKTLPNVFDGEPELSNLGGCLFGEKSFRDDDMLQEAPSGPGLPSRPIDPLWETPDIGEKIFSSSPAPPTVAIPERRRTSSPPNAGSIWAVPQIRRRKKPRTGNRKPCGGLRLEESAKPKDSGTASDSDDPLQDDSPRKSTPTKVGNYIKAKPSSGSPDSLKPNGHIVEYVRLKSPPLNGTNGIHVPIPSSDVTIQNPLSPDHEKQSSEPPAKVEVQVNDSTEREILSTTEIDELPRDLESPQITPLPEKNIGLQAKRHLENEIPLTLEVDKSLGKEELLPPVTSSPDQASQQIAAKRSVEHDTANKPECDAALAEQESVLQMTTPKMDKCLGAKAEHFTPTEIRTVLTQRILRKRPWKEVLRSVPEKTPAQVRHWYHVRFTDIKNFSSRIPWPAMDKTRMGDLARQPEVSWETLKTVFKEREIGELEHEWAVTCLGEEAWTNCCNSPRLSVQLEKTKLQTPPNLPRKFPASKSPSPLKSSQTIQAVQSSPAPQTPRVSTATQSDRMDEISDSDDPLSEAFGLAWSGSGLSAIQIDTPPKPPNPQNRRSPLKLATTPYAARSERKQSRLS
ncbi:hypothetical protein FQN55_006359 [Onygenales sp. PD_40]|nr:hypothetical protein FQN55_006359 [Onygenales sp. PD_40]KAK2780862.1 hypothetical protein FQN53_000930 [Emmonsiellopsis sp. PD_33]KAK2793679.1 hypothetical protein FQN52_000631 [Onygenales sp. PD_12]KAK2804771.1 hypothetical protein FQN51_001413 [Onygenales sp. PD_10]